MQKTEMLQHSKNKSRNRYGCRVKGLRRQNFWIATRVLKNMCGRNCIVIHPWHEPHMGLTCLQWLHVVRFGRGCAMIMGRCCGWDPRLERNINQLATPRDGTSTSAVDGFAAQACDTNAQHGDCFFCLRMTAHTLTYKHTLTSAKVNMHVW